jgi:hypothetical protein
LVSNASIQVAGRRSESTSAATKKHVDVADQHLGRDRRKGQETSAPAGPTSHASAASSKATHRPMKPCQGSSCIGKKAWGKAHE